MSKKGSNTAVALPDPISSQSAVAAYFTALNQTANEAISSIFQTSITPIQSPAQGDFNWSWQNESQVFNQGTFDFISAQVSPGSEAPGTAQLSPAGGFPNSYVQVVTAIDFSLSTADQTTLNNATENASAQGQAVVSDYEGIFGEITGDQMTAAQAALGPFAISTKQDYVIGYIMGYIWSGCQQEKQPALTYTQMAEARDLTQLLPQMPSSGVPVLADVTEYLNLLAPVTSLQDQLMMGAWILGQLRSNTEQPTESNGGMQLVDPNTGAISGFQVGYTINAAITQIRSDLNTSSRSFSLGMEVSQASDSSLQVSINGGVGFTVGSLLQFSLGTQFSQDLTAFQGTSSNCTVELNYQGFTLVPIAALAWQQATNVGWFFGDPIAEAVRNAGQDVTGFKFASNPPFNMGSLEDGGNFGMLTNLLISNYPTVTIHYQNADFSSFQQAWNKQLSGNLTLFGSIPLGTVSEGAYGSSIQQGASNGEFTLQFTPSSSLLSVPDLQKTAYIIGGSFDFPGSE